MKRILILLLTICSIASYGQTLIDPSASPTTARINSAISEALPTTGTDTYSVSPVGSFSYTWLTGKAVSITIPSSDVNTGSSTLNFDGLGAKNIQKWSSGSLVDVVSGDIIGTVRLRYDGTQFVMEGGTGGGGSQSLQDVITVSPAITSDINITNSTGKKWQFSLDDGAGNFSNVVIDPINGNENYIQTGNANNASNVGILPDQAVLLSSDLTNTYGDATVKVSTSGQNIVEITATNFGSTEQGKVLTTPLTSALISGTAGTSKVELTKTTLEIAPNGNNGSNGQILQSDGQFATWQTISTGSGTVTSVSVTTANGVSGSVATATTTPAISLTLGAITPTSVNSVVLSGSSTPTLAVTGTSTISGTHSGTSSGTNTGDQTTVTGNAGTATVLQTSRTIGTVTGDATSAGSSFNGSANNTNALTLATVNSNVGSFGSATQVGGFTVNAKGLITAASNTTITPAVGSITGLGTGVGTWLATPSYTNFLSAITGTSPYWLSASGTTMTGANTITGTTTNTLKLKFDAMGTGITDGAGVWLENSTAGALGAPQNSPSVVLDSYVWGTTLGTSQRSRWRIFGLPTQAATPVGIIKFYHSLAGAADQEILGIQANGQYVFGASLTQATLILKNTNSQISSTGVGNINFITNLGTTGYALTHAPAGPVSSTTGENGALGLPSGGFTPASGSASYNHLTASGTINMTGSSSGTVRGFWYKPVYTAARGDVYGLLYDPTETSILGNNYSFISTSQAARGGVGSATPNSTWQVTGSFAAGYVAKTANYTLTGTDYLVNCTANSFTITLPTAVGIKGRQYIIKNTGTATVITVATTSSQTVDGAVPATLTSMTPMRLMSDDANWITW